MFLENRNDSEGLFIVLEPRTSRVAPVWGKLRSTCGERSRTMLFHPFIECGLARMSEGRMSQVMRECDALGEIFIESESPRDVPRDLCDFHRVRQAASVVIPFSTNEDLCFSLEPPKGL